MKTVCDHKGKIDARFTGMVKAEMVKVGRHRKIRERGLKAGYETVWLGDKNNRSSGS